MDIKKFFPWNKKVHDDAFKQYEEESEVGERCHTVLNSEAFSILKAEIIEPMMFSAFENFTYIEPKDHDKVIEAQVIYKSLQSIEEVLKNKVMNGKNARTLMSEYDSTTEDES